MEKKIPIILNREELAERYGLSEKDPEILLDTFEAIENAVYKFLSLHL